MTDRKLIRDISMIVVIQFVIVTTIVILASRLQ